MGDMFRSEEMVLAQIFLQQEAAYLTVSELGESGLVQFKDLNTETNAFQRKFVNEVRRCHELDRMLRFIEGEIKREEVPIPDILDVPKAPNPKEIVDLEARIEKTEQEIEELSESSIKLNKNYLELTELRHILEKIQDRFKEQDEVASLESARKSITTEDFHSITLARERLGFIAGVISTEKFSGFERMLWRVSRGNVLVRKADIEETLIDPVTGNEMRKVAFAAFFQGEQLKAKVQKVCAGYHASIYHCPSRQKDREEMLKGVLIRLEDLTLVLNQTQDHRHRVLVNVARELQTWSIMVRKMKAIYHTLNLFNMDVTRGCLIAECWVPTKDITLVQRALVDGSNISDSSIPSFLNVITTNEDPPTFNRTNKFTRGFQTLIDSYGMASYREVNPALYTIVSFPFLFAVMFGDMGHAIIVTALGLWMVLSEKKIMAKKIKDEIFTIFFGGRYIILMMGIFSFYTGLIYNDFFSKSLNIFGSKWFTLHNVSYTGELLEGAGKQFQLNPTDQYEGTPYFMGMDPVWQLSKNKIIFLNSYKMKLSIIFGVTHMIFGVCMSVVNMVHFRRYSKIFLEFLPQVLLLCFLFLYLVILMFIKWIMFSSDPGASFERGNYCAPSVLIYFINMMLFKKNSPFEGCDPLMFSYQDKIQIAIVVLSLLCIPWLLLGTPLYIQFTRRTKAKRSENALKEPGEKGGVLDAGDTPLKSQEGHNVGREEQEEEPMSEIYIHQAIHTIEYALSTISHTASYLRLWALSLAHARYLNVAMIFLLFPAFAGLTLAILVTMEGLSAFLHTLRLHWVEFMSKFYEGFGYPFQPFAFKSILDQEDSVEE